MSDTVLVTITSRVGPELELEASNIIASYARVLNVDQATWASGPRETRCLAALVSGQVGLTSRFALAIWRLA